MNVLYKAGEIGFVLRDSAARLFITWSGSADEAAKGAADAGVLDIVVLTLPGMQQPDIGTPFEHLLAAVPEGTTAPFFQSEPGDTAVIVYTAGTTGRPK